MPDVVVAEFLRQGLAGAVIVSLGVAYYRLSQDYKALQTRLEALQERRVTDAKAVQDQLLDNNTHCVTALTNATSAMEASKEAMTEMKGAIKDLSDDIRRGGRS